MSVVIIGAGPCGLGAAWRFVELGFEDFIVLEATDRAGGLASSFKDKMGFVWDVGGHVQFSHYADFDRVMDTVLPGGWLHHHRKAAVWLQNRFVPCPFQYNLWRLEPDTVQACLKGLEELERGTSAPPPASFGEWVDRSFGSGIASVFMRPYNFKVWAYPLETMSCHWIGERVAQVDLERLRVNIQQQVDDDSWGPNSTFRFPKEGGTGAIWRSTARHVGASKFRYERRVKRVDLEEHRLDLDDGTVLRYESLLSTIPLTSLAELSGLKLSGPLLSSATHIVGVGLEGSPKPVLKDMCWMYFPEADCPFYRVTMFSNYSPGNVPDSSRYWSLICETSASAHKLVDQTRIVEETIQGLLNTGLISSRDEIVSTWYHVADPGYPTPSLQRDEVTAHAMSALARHDVYSRGRFGAWKYEVSNQDHAFMQGFEWADWVVAGTSEVTIADPAGINGQGKRPPRALPATGGAGESRG